MKRRTDSVERPQASADAIRIAVDPQPLSGCEYRLIDFGSGRKLETIGEYLIDRPCPAADGVAPLQAGRWEGAGAIYRRVSKAPGRSSGERKTGGAASGWQFRSPWPKDSAVDCGGFRMPVQPTPFGHIGLFPEQAPNWEWLRELVTAAGEMRVLNLFGYTGASTLAAAAAGAQVTHVDAAKPNVEAARRAADASGLSEAPIRYLVDDARKFTAREVRRGRSYDLVVLDPPAYGHGNRGTPWRLQRDLWPLLEDCLRLVPRGRGGALITGHSAEVGPAEIRPWLARHRFSGFQFQSGRLGLRDLRGRFLDAGFFVRALWGDW